MNERLLGMIAIGVISAHASLAVWLGTESNHESIPPVRERMVVQTIRLKPEQKIKESSKTPPKTANKKPAQKKQPVAKKKDENPVKKQERKNEGLIAQAREKLSQVAKPSKSIAEAKGIESLKIDSLEGGVEDHGYYTQLSTCLRKNLRLPEFGQVRVHLTLSCQGKVILVKIVESQNENNKRYVEKVLPTVNFPPFDKAFKNEKEHTFLITLASDL